jgi:precorrin-6A/cobalt-precorrin-6A reductase
MAKTRILILGGTTEARLLAGRLAERIDLDVTLSLAGRTENPVEHAVPVRVGGFGGAEGLAKHLRDQAVGLLVDATHPYAARISANAAASSQLAGVPIVALRRPAWTKEEGDRWTDVADAAEALRVLGPAPRRVFLALGRQELKPFEGAPHAYLIRSVDPVDPPLDLADARYVLARGPFEEADEVALFRTYGIDTIVCKNSGGSATYAKLVAARGLDIRVLMIRRPTLPDVPSGKTVGEVLTLIDHSLGSTKKRGV